MISETLILASSSRSPMTVAMLESPPLCSDAETRSRMVASDVETRIVPVGVLTVMVGRFRGMGVEDELDADSAEGSRLQSFVGDDLKDLWSLVCGVMNLGRREIRRSTHGRGGASCRR